MRHDIIQLGRAAYALTGRATIPEDVGARWLTGQEHATETAKRRWWDTLAAMRWLTVQVDPKTHRWIGMFDVDPRTSGDVWIGPLAWWKESRAESGPRSWRLSGGLWRPPLVGDTPAHGTTAGYWGTLARTVDGIEAALTWGPTAGRGPGGRLPDYLKPVRKGGPGPDVFIPWRNVLRLAGERAPDDVASSYLRVRYKRRIDAMRAAAICSMPTSRSVPDSWVLLSHSRAHLRLQGPDVDAQQHHFLRAYWRQLSAGGRDHAVSRDFPFEEVPVVHSNAQTRLGIPTRRLAHPALLRSGLVD